MDPRLLGYYNQELKFIREMGAEFATAYPRIASRLGLIGDAECADPYVERLLEGFAFLAARTQLKLEARHPQFTQHLLEMVYPDYLAPLPSCAIAEFVPDLGEGSLKSGVRIARGTSLRTPLAKGEHTSCEFRTAQEVTLWPLVVSDARYIAGSGALGTLGVTAGPAVRAAMRLRLKTVGGLALTTLPLDRLVFFINAAGDLAARIHEQVSANAVGYALRSLSGQGSGNVSGGALQARGPQAIEPVGFGELEALLPATHQGFGGYRLLQEYFALPERYLFFALTGLAGALKACLGEECELFVLLDRADPALENQLDVAQFRLGCTPIVNLFARDIDRLHISAFENEQHLVVDRNRPQDYEIYRLEQVAGIGGAGAAPVPIRPFYALDHDSGAGPPLYYTLQRRSRVAALLQQGTRSHYLGTECYLSMSGADSDQFMQLDARALCTNRDLPMQLSPNARSELLVEGGAPVKAVRCLVGPTAPRPSAAFGDTSWKLISHLSLNYLSLLDGGGTEGAALLRDLLLLHADGNDPAVRRQIEGVRSVGYEPVVRRLPVPGPISHGRGLRITLQMDEAAFEGSGVLRLASVLERFFAAYVSINVFTQTRVLAVRRGEIKEWPPRIGQRPLM